MLVRIAKTWKKPDLFRQTPGSKGEWKGIRFTEDPVSDCDYLVVLNGVPEPLEVSCDPRNAWAFIQEPACMDRIFPFVRKGHKPYARVFTDNRNLRGKRYSHYQTCLPWHVNRTYDELVSAPIPEKSREISWVTSNLAFMPGHRKRLGFLENLASSLPFDLYGRGFNEIPDKWDGIAPYRYTIAFENHSGLDYWTEKLADAFLAWSLPIYYGCTNILAYFPEESMIRLEGDLDDGPERIREAIAANEWKQRLDAIAHARDLVLNKYQFFAFVTECIQGDTRNGPVRPRRLVLPPTQLKYRRSLMNRIRHRLRRNR